MATYDPQRARMRGRDATPAAPVDEAAPTPVDLLLGATTPAVDEPATVDQPAIVDEPAIVDPPAAADPHDHGGDHDRHHEHGPDCDHDHGGIDVRVLAAAGVAAALTVMGIVRARRRRSA